MSRWTRGACVLMFGAPFVFLAWCYAALPPELLVLRIPIVGVFMLAPKSVFTAFRVPLMNLANGLMAAVMLSRAGDFVDQARRRSYSHMFVTLVFTVACKSDFEALEIGLPMQVPTWGFLGSWLTAGTVLSVVFGIGLALVWGRSVPLPWSELRLTLLDKVELVGLFLIYVAIVIASSLVWHRR